MKIFFTKKEYRFLLDMLFVGEWVIDAAEDGDANSGYEILYQKILQHAPEMGCADLIEIEDHECYETLAYEEDMMGKFIDPYNIDNFWDGLASRLAERDLVAQLGEDQFMALERMDRVMRIQELRGVYLKEFEDHGIMRLKIDHQGSESAKKGGGGTYH